MTTQVGQSEARSSFGDEWREEMNGEGMGGGGRTKKGLGSRDWSPKAGGERRRRGC